MKRGDIELKLNYAAWKKSDGEIEVGLFDFPHDKFMQEVHTLGDVLHAIPFVVHGKSYKERQDALRELAIDWQWADCDVSGGLSYGELSDIQDFFYRRGKSLGLLREFRENCIPC